MSQDQDKAFFKDLWDVIIAETKGELRQGEKTIKMFMEEGNLGRSAASYKLSQLVKEGRMEWRWVSVEGKRCKAFRPIREELKKS